MRGDGPVDRDHPAPLWQYAKIIADSAGVGKRQWAFVMERFKKLQTGEIEWDSIREYVKEHNDIHRCLYCGRAGDLTLDHPHSHRSGGMVRRSTMSARNNT